MSRSIGITVEFPTDRAGAFRVDINLKGEQVSQAFTSGRQALDAALLAHDALHAQADEHDEELAAQADRMRVVLPEPRTRPVNGSFLDEAAGQYQNMLPEAPEDLTVVDAYGETRLGRMATPGGVVDPVDEKSATADSCEPPAPAKPLSQEMLESLQKAVDLFCPPAVSEQAQDAQAVGATAQGPLPLQTPMQVAVSRVETRCATARELAAAGRRKALAGAYAEALALFRGAHQHALGASAALVSIEDFEGPQPGSDPARSALADMRRVLLHIKSGLAAAPWPAELREAIDRLA